MFLIEPKQRIRTIAESDDWRRFFPSPVGMPVLRWTLLPSPIGASLAGRAKIRKAATSGEAAQRTKIFHSVRPSQFTQVTQIFLPRSLSLFPPDATNSWRYNDSLHPFPSVKSA
jgi:hypothetical protein